MQNQTETKNEMELAVAAEKARKEKIDTLLNASNPEIYNLVVAALNESLAEDKKAKAANSSKRSTMEKVGRLLVLAYLQNNSEVCKSLEDSFGSGEVFHSKRTTLARARAFAGLFARKEILSYETKRGTVITKTELDILSVLENQVFPESFSLSTACTKLIDEPAKLAQEKLAKRTKEQEKEQKIIAKIFAKNPRKTQDLKPTLEDLKSAFTDSIIDTWVSEAKAEIEKEETEGLAYTLEKSIQEQLVRLAKLNPEKAQALQKTLRVA